MKKTNQIITPCVLLASLVCAGTALAQDYIVNLFDTAGEATSWARWWGAAVQTYEFDSTKDADSNPNSGSLKMIIQFDVAAHGGDNQFCARTDLPNVINGLSYTGLVMDVYFDPSSPQRPWGDYGGLEFGARYLDYSSAAFANVGVTTAGQWVHLVAPIPVTDANITNLAGIMIKMWSGDSGWGQTGDTILWVDNIKLLGSGGPPPQPSMSMGKVTSGLNLIASATGDNAQYQRQNIRTVGNGFSWVPRAFDPVTYTISIKEYPDKAHSGFQTHLFLAPERDLPYGPGDASVDWNATNAVFFQISVNDNGTGTGRFMYKTNQPGGNSMYWNTDPTAGGVGTLGDISSPSPVGPWSLAFDSLAGTITITEPTGLSTNFPMLSAAANALFNGPLYAYVGIQPNNTNNLNQAAVIAAVSMQSADPAFPSFETVFTGTTLDSAVWAVVAADASGVLSIPEGAVYALSWTLPDTGFKLQTSPTLSPASWTEVVPAFLTVVAGRRTAIISDSQLPAPGSGYFVLRKLD